MVECKNCNSEVNTEATTCYVCQFPITGTEKEQGVFIGQQIVQQGEVEKAIDSLKTSRKLLFSIAGFQFLIGFKYMYYVGLTSDVNFNLFIGTIILGFAFLTFYKPLLAIIVPLLLISFYYIFQSILDPSFLLKGIASKLFVLGGLGYGLFNILKANKILQQNPYLSSLLGFGKI